MPNIEIHGVITGKETSLRIAIFAILKDKRLDDDLVVTIERTSTITEDKDGKLQPFLRVIDNDPAEAKQIAFLLSRTLSMDVEVIELLDFFPAPK